MKEQLNSKGKVEFLTIRLDPQRHAEIKMAAKSAGMTAAAFARNATFEKLKAATAPV